VEVNSTDLATLETSYNSEIGTIDLCAIFGDFKTALQTKIAAGDLAGVLELYDNKGMLSRAASRLGLAGPKSLLEKVGRLLGTDAGRRLRVELFSALPTIP
jgi:hypothetical protein